MKTEFTENKFASPEEERRIIWTIQTEKHGRSSKEYDLQQLARMTEGFTGSEVEQVFIESMYMAFDQGREPSDLDIAQVITATVPLSKLMAEQVQSLRSWAKGRARLATSAVISCAKARKIAA